jgi:hypothetical protein
VKLPRLLRPATPRRAVSDVVDLAGLGCLDGAAWWWHPLAGLVAVGLSLLLIGWVMDR